MHAMMNVCMQAYVAIVPPHMIGKCTHVEKAVYCLVRGVGDEVIPQRLWRSTHVHSALYRENNLQHERLGLEEQVGADPGHLSCKVLCTDVRLLNLGMDVGCTNAYTCSLDTHSLFYTCMLALFHTLALFTHTHRTLPAR